MASECTATITELPDGRFRVQESVPSGWLSTIIVPRDVMLTFLGDFSEKVLALRMDALSQALTRQDTGE